MTFETLKDLHPWKIIVLLHSGEKYEGVITSQVFVLGSNHEILEISLLGEWNIVKVKCGEIKEITKVEKIM